MNDVSILVLVDEIDMCAHLAKIATINSYNLIFYKSLEELNVNSYHCDLFIIDLNNYSEQDFREIAGSEVLDKIKMLGYCSKPNSQIIKKFNSLGFDLIIKRGELLKNLNTIIIKMLNNR